MLTRMLKAKLHTATVTHAELHYDGSCAIDAHLLQAAGMREFEAIDIYNITNGTRLSTYIIQADPGSGIISMNGAAARHAQVGDRLIIATYAQLTEAELKTHRPQLIYLDQKNTITRTNQSIPPQAA